jgi:TorA maturation chaperone TorD
MCPSRNRAAGEMELFRALAVLSEAPTASHARITEVLGMPPLPLGAAHTELFLIQLPPYASMYLGSEGMLGGDVRARVAGFLRALHLNVPDEPDHLAVLLAAYAAVAEREAEETEAARALLWREARKALLWEHLLSWLPCYLVKFQQIAGDSYHAWGLLLADALRAEARSLGRQAMLPLHLREAPGLPSPAEAGVAAVVAAILSPVRSGMILTRSDLAHAAGSVGVGVRLGERTSALRSLLSHDREAMLAWLREEADRWRAAHAANAECFGPVSEFWVARAAGASRQLISWA